MTFLPESQLPLIQITLTHQPSKNTQTHTKQQQQQTNKKANQRVVYASILIIIMDLTPGPDAAEPSHTANASLTAEELEKQAGEFRKKGNYRAAVETYEKALPVRIKESGEESAETAGCVANLSGSCNSAGDYAKALDHGNRALAIFRKVHGEDHPDTASSYNNLGEVYKNKGEYDKAIEYLLKALAI
jgi:tetratricopeptide (TPR) repeat protein